ncbi:MAG: hypothetical protein ACP5VF_07725 [Acidobacteriota bacterium]
MGAGLGIGLAAATLAGGSLQEPSGQPLRFCQVTFRLLTTGSHQTTQTIGTFSSTLPLGKAGQLDRLMTITNQTRDVSTSLALKLSLTPVLDESGQLHCVILSDVSPQGGNPTTRAKDIVFATPGEQLMELFADPRTGTQVVMAVQAALADPSATEARSKFPPILFLVRVEQWNGAQRSEIETLQLQSLEGKAVGHDYQRNVPRWVEGEPSGPDQISTQHFKELDFSKGTPVIQAGEGFTIPLEEKKSSKARKEKAAKEKTDQGGKKETPSPPRKLVWDKEFYHLTLSPLSIRDDHLDLKVQVVGQMLSPTTHQPLPAVDISTEKSLLPNQPVPFYLTRDVAGATQGYVLWIVARWGNTGASSSDFTP